VATATCGKGQTAVLAVAGAERRKRIKPSIEGKSALILLGKTF